MITQNIFLLMFFLLVALVVLMELLMPGVIAIVAPGFVAKHYDIALRTLRITTPFMLVISLTAVLTAFLNSMQQFAIESSSQAIVNLTMIFGLLWFKDSSIYAIVSVYLVGGCLQLLWCMAFCYKSGLSLTFKMPRIDPTIKKIFHRMFQGATASGIMQLNTFVDSCLASLLPAGSVSLLFYADRLNQLPLSIIGVSLASVVLPSLSRKAHDKEKHTETLVESLLAAFEIGLFAAAILYIFSNVFIYIIYYRMNFSLDACYKSALAVKAYALGLPAYIMCKIFASYFFSQKNIRIALYISTITLVTNVIGNLILMRYFGHVGLALATSIAGWAGFIFYCALLKDSILTDAILLKVRNVILWSFANIFVIFLAHKQFISLSKTWSNLFMVSLIISVIFLSYFGLGYKWGLTNIRFKTKSA